MFGRVFENAENRRIYLSMEFNILISHLSCIWFYLTKYYGIVNQNNGISVIPPLAKARPIILSVYWLLSILTAFEHILKLNKF